MATYRVMLLDREGHELTTDYVDGLPAARARARYLLSNSYARNIENTHDAMGTWKVEVQPEQGNGCLWDAFIDSPRERAVVYAMSVLRHAHDWQEGQEALADHAEFGPWINADPDPMALVQLIIRFAEDRLGDDLPY